MVTDGIDGISWTRGWWMLPASMPLKDV